jgi:cyclopropane fatty-acyl-phospholipid synthase-like methyltransferase
VLEIGTGPFGGVLPLIQAVRKVGIDPLCSEYRKLKTLEELPGIEYVEAYFEEWRTEDRFDTVIAIDALDHGEMGFHLLPRIFDLLRSGGRLYLHVHFRPPDYLNLIHDHPMTEKDLDRFLGAFAEEKRQFYEHDVGGDFCRALVGVWRRP